MTAFVIPNAIQITTRQAKYTFASFLSRDTTFDVIHNIWKLERPDDATSISSGGGDRSLNPAESMEQVAGGTAAAAAAATTMATKKATQCACGKDGSHFREKAMETVLPGTPERIYNLLFASGFMKDFMAGSQKLMGEWLTLVDKNRRADIFFKIFKCRTGRLLNLARSSSKDTCPTLSLLRPVWVLNRRNAKSLTRICIAILTTTSLR
jgi:hypothetical protein